MKKKLDTRFPAARIKKIMQSDDDVGKIAMAVPLLISKALELFLQDLCDRTYEITLNRGAKTMSSSHLKQCVQSFNVFDFLKEIVRGVRDLGDSSVAGDDHVIEKKRKLADDEDEDGCVYSSSKLYGTGDTHIGRSRRGRGRGRGRGHGSRTLPTEVDRFEDDPNMHDLTLDLLSSRHDEPDSFSESKGDELLGEDTKTMVRGFDLNLDLDENGDTTSVSAFEPRSTPTKSVPEMTPEEHHECSLGEIGNMMIYPIQLANLNLPLGEDEDYDEGEGV